MSRNLDQIRRCDLRIARGTQMNSYSGNRGPLVWSVTVSVIANLLLATLAAHAGSVFDDTWTPPTPTKTAKSPG
jgi:hypothetical protein